MRQRVCLNAERKNGFSATVSARALKVASRNSFSGFFHQPGTSPPTHLLQYALAIALDHRVNCSRGANIVARLKVRRRRWVGQPVKLHQLSPCVHPGEATAHGAIMSRLVAVASLGSRMVLAKKSKTTAPQ